MRTSEQINELATALVKAQKEFPSIPRSKEVSVVSKRTGARYSFKYAPLDSILHAVRKPLVENGLWFLQSVSGETLTTRLIHSSGQWIEGEPLPVKTSEEGSQAFGSAITYARRYDLCALLGIVADDDDDGNAADGNSVEVKKDPKITPAGGVFDSMPVDVQTMLRDYSGEITGLFSRGDVAGAHDHYVLLKSDMDADQQVALWSLLDSKCRAAIKKHGTKEKASAV